MDNVTMRFEGGKWRMLDHTLEQQSVEQRPAEPQSGEQQSFEQQPRLWRKEPVVAMLEGIRWGKRSFVMPAEGGAIAIDVLPLDETFLLVAIFGDGLWRFNGHDWKRAFPDLPAKARDKQPWLATRRRCGLAHGAKASFGARTGNGHNGCSRTSRSFTTHNI
jgi:hypothetical protein